MNAPGRRAGELLQNEPLRKPWSRQPGPYCQPLPRVLLRLRNEGAKLFNYLFTGAPESRLRRFAVIGGKQGMRDEIEQPFSAGYGSLSLLAYFNTPLVFWQATQSSRISLLRVPQRNCVPRPWR